MSCGVFAIAAVYLMASGRVLPVDMGQVNFGFERALWQWLSDCDVSDNFTQPPIQAIQAPTEQNITLYAIQGVTVQ